MDTIIFVGFRDQGTVKGCSWRTRMEQYTEKKETVLDMLQATGIEYARDIFDHIEWNPSDLQPRNSDGIHLIKLIKVGIDEYKESSKQTFKFLNGNQKGYDVKPDLAQYVGKANGRTTARLFDSSSDFHQNEFDIAFIFDLDTGKVETLTNQPSSVK